MCIPKASVAKCGESPEPGSNKYRVNSVYNLPAKRMKRANVINAVYIASAVVMLSHFVVYSVGYHRGARAVQNEWYGTMHLDPVTHRVVFEGPHSKIKGSLTSVQQNAIPEKAGR